MKWFKKRKRALPEDTTCRNCGAQTVGRYCQECGQDVFAGTGQPVLKLIGQVLENAFALEGKTPRTLANLLLRPGFLSNEYKAGRINRYVHPVKLFWMSTIIFFALLISLVDLNIPKDRDLTFKFNGETVYESDSSSDAVSSNTMTEQDEDAKKLKEEKEKKVNDFVNMLRNYFSKFAPYVIFLLIPFFAMLLVLFFIRKKYYYIYHLTFAVHFHSFLWIFLSLLLIIHMFTKTVSFPTLLNLFLFFVPGIYLVVALHHFYRTNSWWRTTGKAILISLLYAILIMIVTILLIILVTIGNKNIFV
jgi:hypothetical protein